MSRTKGSKNKVKKVEKQTELFDFTVKKKRGRPKREDVVNAVALIEKEHEEIHEDGLDATKEVIKKVKINKDLREKERIEDPTLIDSTDLFIDDEDGEISLDGKRTGSYICRNVDLICKNCKIIKQCKKENKRIDK